MSDKPFLFAFLSLFVLIGIAISARGLYLCSKAQQTQTWEKTRTSKDDDGNRTKTIVQRVKTQYSYQFGGEQYIGNRVAVGINFGHLPVYEKLKTANTISIFVNPKNPSESVIINVINRDEVILILIGLVWTIIVLLVMKSKFHLSEKINYLTLAVSMILFYLCHYKFQWGHIYLEKLIEIIN